MSTAPERPLDHIDPATRRRIENAVLNTFSDREFHRVSLIEIATKAQVSLQTIYKYYGGKDVLLFSSLDTWLGQLSNRMIDHLEAIENFQDRLRKVLWLVFDYFDENPKVAMVIMSSVYINTWRKDDTFRQPELFALLMKVINEGREQGILTDEVEETAILDLFIGVTSRTISMWILRGQQGRLTDKAAPTFNMIWRAISRN